MRDPAPLIVLVQGALIPWILPGPEKAVATILASLVVVNLAATGRTGREAGVASLALALYTILAGIPGTGPWLKDLTIVLVTAGLVAAGADPLRGTGDPLRYAAGAVAGVGAAIILGAPSLAYPALGPAMERMLASSRDGWILVAAITLSPVYPGPVPGAYALAALRLPAGLAGYDAAARAYVEWAGGWLWSVGWPL